MIFILVCFLAALFWSATIIIDRNLVETKFRDSTVVLLISFLTSSVPILTVSFFFIDVKILETEILILMFSVALFYIVGYLVYFKSIQTVDSSKVSVILKSSSVIIILFSIIIYGETHDLNTYLGMGLVILASFLSSIDEDFSIENMRGGFLAIFSALLFSIVVILQKFVIDGYTIGYKNFYFWQYFLSFLLVVTTTLVTNYKYKVWQVVKDRPKVLLFPMISQTINEVGEALWIIAIGLGALSIATTITSINPVIVFIVSIFLHLLGNNHYLNEDVRKTTIKLKIISIVFVIVGFTLIFYL